MAVGVVATLPVQKGKNEEFEAVFRARCTGNCQEPGCMFYTLNRSKSDPQSTRCSNHTLTRTHSKHTAKPSALQALTAKLGPLLAGRPDIEYLDGVSDLQLPKEQSCYWSGSL